MHMSKIFSRLLVIKASKPLLSCRALCSLTRLLIKSFPPWGDLSSRGARQGWGGNAEHEILLCLRLPLVPRSLR